MEYRKYGETYYVRMDGGDEVVATLLDKRKKEGIRSACYSGIGGCSDVEMQVFIPEKKEFETTKVEGMLELVSLMGDVVCDYEGKLCHHTHAMFAYKEGDEHKVIAGHMKSTTVLYTAEIELRPVKGGVISKQFDPETGTGFWKF